MVNEFDLVGAEQLGAKEDEFAHAFEMVGGRTFSIESIAKIRTGVATAARILDLLTKASDASSYVALDVTPQVALSAIRLGLGAHPGDKLIQVATAVFAAWPFPIHGDEIVEVSRRAVAPSLAFSIANAAEATVALTHRWYASADAEGQPTIPGA